MSQDKTAEQLGSSRIQPLSDRKLDTWERMALDWNPGASEPINSDAFLSLIVEVKRLRAELNTRADSVEAVAWMTHHDAPMVFTYRGEAAEYCNDDEQPIPLFTHPRATAVEGDDVHPNLLAAAQAYYTRYCVDEADDDPDWTGCSEQQSIDARELRDAISSAIASREGAS